MVWALSNPVGGDGWGSAQIELVERLLPHVRQFVRVRQALAAAAALGSGLSGLLDGGRLGVVQLDRGGRVLVANGPALDLLRRGDGLADGDGALRAAAPADDERLQALLWRALPDLWGEAPAGGSMTVRRPSGRAQLALHVSPVGDAAADLGSHRAAALLAEGRQVPEIAALTGWQASYVRRAEADLKETGRVRPSVAGAPGAGPGDAAPGLRACRAAPVWCLAVRPSQVRRLGRACVNSPIWDYFFMFVNGLGSVDRTGRWPGIQPAPAWKCE
ncbi:MAG: hypothetical protein OXI20_17180 [Rhodospirillales bacterium]|nr:hypothetical protein [Rhodospirillales bacterium]